MRLDTEKAKTVLEENEVTLNDFAMRFGIHRSYAYNVMNGTVEAGRKFFAAWAKFCRLFELDFLSFFIFDEDDRA